MDPRRIVVTGLGAVSSLGPSVGEAWAALLAGRGGIRPATIESGRPDIPDHHLPLALAAHDIGPVIDARFGRPTAGALDPFSRFALAAAIEALDHAGLAGHPVLEERCAVVLGHGLGGMEALETGYRRYYRDGSPRLAPLTVPKVMLSAAVSATAMGFGIRGPVFAVSSACASSAHAVIQAAALIAAGQADVALAGGSEALCTPAGLRAWDAIRALSPTGCRPFSADRDGMVLGEGGAVMVLEAHGHAVARGAAILGELVGSGMTSDAFRITQPTVEGPARAMRQACAAAGALEREDILVSAHGTGTVLNDAAEARALQAVFGAERARRLPVIATKSAHGHLVGGSAALQAVLGLMALRQGLAPPILNCTAPDPDLGLDLVLHAPRPVEAGLLLVNAFAFGGLNASLLFAAA